MVLLPGGLRCVPHEVHEELWLLHHLLVGGPQLLLHHGDNLRVEPLLVALVHEPGDELGKLSKLPQFDEK